MGYLGLGSQGIEIEVFVVWLCGMSASPGKCLVKLNSTSYLVASAAVEYFADFVLGHYQDPPNYHAAFLHRPVHLVLLADCAAHTLEAGLYTVVARWTWVLA